MIEPYLVITIDTEEGFDWNAPFTRNQYTTQTLFDHDFYMSGFYRAYNIRPIALVSYPLLKDADCGRLLKKYQAERRYILGTHLHSWVTPPFDEELSNFNSFSHNLPAELEYQKLQTLTKAFIDVLGQRPLYYKGGRYSVSSRTFEALFDLGYRYDFTPFANCNFRYKHGVDFTHISNNPLLPLGNKKLLCYPATADYVGLSSYNPWLRKLFHKKLFIKLRGQGVLSKLNIMNFVRLSPEGIREDEMKNLTRHLLLKGQRYFHLSYHASSFTKNGTPYSRSQYDIETIEKRLKNYIHFFREIGGRVDINENDLNNEENFYKR